MRHRGPSRSPIFRVIPRLSLRYISSRDLRALAALGSRVLLTATRLLFDLMVWANWARDDPESASICRRESSLRDDAAQETAHTRIRRLNQICTQIQPKADTLLKERKRAPYIVWGS